MLSRQISSGQSDKIPLLLWEGGFLWKIPYNGRGNPEHRVVAIKRANFPGVSSRKVQIVERSGENVQSKEPTSIFFPPTLIWYSSLKPGEQTNARELILYNDSYLALGHNTPAFWKLASREGPLPRPELCFSVVTSTRTLDLAAETLEEAALWRDAFSYVLNVQVDPTDESNTLFGCDYRPPLLNVPLPPPTMPTTMLPPAPPFKEKSKQSAAPPIPPSGASTSMDTSDSQRNARKESLKASMFSAAHKGDLKGLEEVLQKGVPVNLMEPGTADTPLLIACKNGNADMVKLCLQFGAKNDPHPEFGQTALHAAVSAGHVGAAAALLEAAAKSQADAIIANLADMEGRAALHVASQTGNQELVTLLMNHGGDVVRADDSGQTCLHIASAAGNIGCLAVLLDHGGDVVIDAQDAQGNTALHWAVRNCHLDCVRLLLETAADASIRNAAGKLAYHLATSALHKKVKELLFEYHGSEPPIDDRSSAFSSTRSSKNNSPGVSTKSAPQGRWVEGSLNSNSAVSMTRKSLVSGESGATSSDEVSVDIREISKRGNGMNYSLTSPSVLRKSSDNDESLPRPHTTGNSSPALTRNTSNALSTPAKGSIQQSYRVVSQSSLQTPSGKGGNAQSQPSPLYSQTARISGSFSPAASIYSPMSARETRTQNNDGTNLLTSPVKVNFGSNGLAGNSNLLNFTDSILPQKKSNVVVGANMDGPDNRPVPLPSIQPSSSVTYLPYVDNEGHGAEAAEVAAVEDTVGANSEYDYSASLENFSYGGESWDVYVTEEGYTYYLNNVSSHSQWYDPREYGIITEDYTQCSNDGVEGDAALSEDFLIGDKDGTTGGSSDSENEDIDPSRVRVRTKSNRRSGATALPNEKTPAFQQRVHLSPQRKPPPIPIANTPPHSGAPADDPKGKIAIRELVSPKKGSRSEAGNDDSSDDDSSEIDRQSTSRLRRGVKRSPKQRKQLSAPSTPTQPVAAAPKATSPKIAEQLAMSIDESDATLQSGSDWDTRKINRGPAVPQRSAFISSTSNPRLQKSLLAAKPLSISFADSPTSPFAVNNPMMRFPQVLPGAAKGETLDTLREIPELQKYVNMAIVGVAYENIYTKMKHAEIDLGLIYRLMSAMGVDDLTSLELAEVDDVDTDALVSSAHHSTPLQEMKESRRTQGSPHADSNPVRSIALSLQEEEDQEAENNEIVHQFFTAAPGTATKRRVSPRAADGADLVAEKLYFNTDSLEIIDERRAQNIIVHMLPYRSSGSFIELLQSLASLDSFKNKLFIDGLEDIEKILPSELEIQRLRQLQNCKHPAEIFLKQAALFYPELPARIHCFVGCSQFPQLCDIVTKKMRVLISACEMVTDNQNFRSFLDRLATVCKSVHVELVDRSASRFSVDTLLKMNTIKVLDKKTTPLELMVKAVLGNGQEALLDILPQLDQYSCLRLSFKDIDNEYQEVVRGLQSLENTLSSAEKELAYNVLHAYNADIDSMAKPLTQKFHDKLLEHVLSFRIMMSVAEKVNQELVQAAVTLVSFFGEDVDILDTVKVFSALQQCRFNVAACKSNVNRTPMML